MQGKCPSRCAISLDPLCPYFGINLIFFFFLAELVGVGCAFLIDFLLIELGGLYHCISRLIGFLASMLCLG